MAKPRIFVSSTFYDLQYVRENIEGFISGYGYEPVLFESSDISLTPNNELEDSCYKEISNCSMMILIIGSRYGTPSTKDRNKNIDSLYKEYTSITKKELDRADEIGIPYYIFVSQKVLSEHETYKKNINREDIEYAHVDNVSIFKLLDKLFSTPKNYITGFSKFEDISEWLKSQWAGEFQEHLSQLKESKNQKKIHNSIEGLEITVERLKLVTDSLLEASVTDPHQLKKIMEEIKEKSKDLEKKELKLEIMKFDFNAHLINKHGFLFEEIVSAHRKSDSLKKFEQEMKNTKPGCRCLYLNLTGEIKHSVFHKVPDIDETRKLLELNPFTNE